jgi:hypothetical protein
MLTYEEQLQIGTLINAGITRALTQAQIEDSQLILAIAQSILVEIDQGGYQIVRK